MSEVDGNKNIKVITKTKNLIEYVNIGNCLYVKRYILVYGSKVQRRSPERLLGLKSRCERSLGRFLQYIRHNT